MKRLHSLTIGYTDNGFRAYESGADQQVITLGVWLEEDEVYSPEEMGEVVYEATNIPAVLEGTDATAQVQRLWREMTDQRSLSKGDTVTWDGVTVAVELAGWRRVEVPA